MSRTIHTTFAPGILVGLFLLACGDNKPPPKTDNDPSKNEGSGKTSTGPTPVVQQELGSIDQKAVERLFDKLQNPLETCHKQGRDRVEYLSGDVKVFLRIDQAGKVRYGYFEESTLGDRDTEKCILDVFSREEWPKPVGGEGEVRHGFGWGPGGERAPTSWGPEKVTSALDDAKEVKKDVAKCKSGVKGDFKITAYVEEDDSTPVGGADNHEHHNNATPAKPPEKKKPGKKGDKKGPSHPSGGAPAGKFKALGVSAPSKEGAEKVDCIVDALKKLPLPSPGSYAAKVSFSI
jgi:hypothetical protein